MTEAGPETARGGKGRWPAKRKVSVILELPRGADLESTSRKYGVTAATLSERSDAFLFHAHGFKPWSRGQGRRGSTSGGQARLSREASAA